MGDYHRSRHEKLEDLVVWIQLMAVVMKKRAPMEVEVTSALARRDNERGVIREAPFWAYL